ncbi:MAG: hypothetical protein OZ928_06525 [Polyangiaceae bacterium]|nr:hypothetical protein [Polyangiaceae bacterium]
MTTPTTAVETTISRSERRGAHAGVARPGLGGVTWLRAARGPLAALALALGVMGCSSCGESSAPAPSASSSAAALTPVPAPANLLADLYVPTPPSTWGALRALVGGPVMLMPAGIPLLSTTLLGLPAATAGLLDESTPVLGAIVEQDGEPRIVLGLHVRNGREVIAALASGSDAKYRAKRDDASGLTVLEPVPGKAPAEIRLGVAGSYLVASKDAAALVAAGPYVARTLSGRPMPAGGGIVVVADHRALAGPIATQVKTAWKLYREHLAKSAEDERASHGGRAPDFGDPAAALLGAGAVVDDVVAVLESSDELRLVIEPVSGRLDARLELRPGKSGAAADFLAGMVRGPMAQLGQLPSAAALSIETRTTPASRADSAKATGAALTRFFGERLVETDRQKLDAALGDVAHGRGDDSALALMTSPSGVGVVLRTSTADDAVFVRGLKSALGLLSVPAFAAPVERFAGKVTVKHSTTKVKGVDGAVQRAQLTLKPRAPAPGEAPIARLDGPTTLEVLWFARDGVGYGAIAKQASPFFGALVSAGASPDQSLAAEVPVVEAARRVGDDATFALLADPVKLGIASAPGHAAAAPVVLGLGRGADHAWLRVELPEVAIRGVLRFAMGAASR